VAVTLMCVVKTENDCFRYTDVTCVQYRCWYRSIIADTDTEPIPAVSADTEYPMPVSVSPYFIVIVVSLIPPKGSDVFENNTFKAKAKATTRPYKDKVKAAYCTFQGKIKVNLNSP